MKTIRSTKSLQKLMLNLRNRNTIAFVPTMGDLHDGHLSLVKRAKRLGNIVVVSIFVNPTQFGPNEDFEDYPRREKSDLEKLRNLDVDFAFLPKVEDIYNDGFQTVVVPGGLSETLCGKSRPGHFDGVATIVLKLFQIVQPHFAIFGQKDFQQIRVIEQMVLDLNIPTKVIRAPIVREKDGLAMSSRNRYLNQSDRQLAVAISRGLKNIKRTCLDRNISVKNVEKLFLQELAISKRLKLDYIKCVHRDSLTPLKTTKKGQTLVAAAVKIGKTRLIDNILI